MTCLCSGVHNKGVLYLCEHMSCLPLWLSLRVKEQKILKNNEKGKLNAWSIFSLAYKNKNLNCNANILKFNTFIVLFSITLKYQNKREINVKQNILK